jgi:hypothetical protein
MNSEETIERTELPYEPPQVENILTAEDLAREVQYAGAGTAR